MARRLPDKDSEPLMPAGDMTMRRCGEQIWTIGTNCEHDDEAIDGDAVRGREQEWSIADEVHWRTAKGEVNELPASTDNDDDSQTV